MNIAQDKPGKESPSEFTRRVGLKFTNPLLLNRALTHRSYLNEHPEALEDNERLEFLGDAVLDFVVGVWLYNHYPEMSEGDLTRLRAALVSTEQLAKFALSINLGSVMRLGRGEEDNGGRLRSSMLCDMFEAVIGALCLDSGVDPVEKFMAQFLEQTADQILEEQRDRDPKSRFQEWAQSNGHGTPVYKTVAESGPDHAKTFEIEVFLDDVCHGSGRGQSKQDATKKAARNALDELKIQD